MPQQWQRPFHSQGSRTDKVLLKSLQQPVGPWDIGVTNFLVCDVAYVVAALLLRKNVARRACIGMVCDPCASTRTVSSSYKNGRVV